jgi:hypothetical protein
VPRSRIRLQEEALKKRLLVVATLVLAAGSVAAGCGGDDDSTTVTGPTGAQGGQQTALSEDAFLSQANQICKKGEQSLNQAGQQFFKSLGLKQGEQPTAEQVQQFAAETAIPNIQAQITAIEALPAPSGDEDQVQQITDSAQEALDKLKSDPELLSDQSAADPFVDANKLAKQYGLGECAN